MKQCLIQVSGEDSKPINQRCLVRIVLAGILFSVLFLWVSKLVFFQPDDLHARTLLDELLGFIASLILGATTTYVIFQVFGNPRIRWAVSIAALMMVLYVSIDLIEDVRYLRVFTPPVMIGESLFLFSLALYFISFYMCIFEANSVRQELAIERQELAREVENRRDTETKLQKNRQLLLDSQRLAHIGCWEYDFINKTSHWTDEVYRIFGLEPNSIEPTQENFIKIVHPDDGERILEIQRQMLKQKRQFDMHYRVIRPDGSVRMIHAQGQGRYDEEGGITLIYGTCHDITDFHEAEQRRRELETQIQHVQKLESLGVLAGGIAHDFNNLLVGIMGNAGLLQMKVGEEVDFYRHIEEIEKAASRAADLTNQLLAYSGKGHFIKQPVDLSELVEDMGGLLHSSVSKKVELDYQLAKDLPAVQADPTQLRQIVMNLIINASDAIAEGSGRVVVETGSMDCDQERLRSAFLDDDLAPGHYVYLKVTDNGCGMDEATCRRIFDPFFTTKFTGRGLGLAAVLGIVRGHHGGIQIESQPDKGTAFTILFPAVESRALSRADAAPAPMDKLTGRILVVDDECSVREMVKAALTEAGAKVTMAENGREALALIQTAEIGFEAVLLDMTMPEMNGVETLEAIRRLNPTLKVIMSSGYNEACLQESETAPGLTPDGFIQKPYRPAQLIQKIAGVLQSTPA